MKNFLRAQYPKAWRALLLASLFHLTLSVGCTPKVEVAISDKPITINLNVKIDHEVKVKIENDLESEVFSDSSDLF